MNNLEAGSLSAGFEPARHDHEGCASAYFSATIENTHSSLLMYLIETRAHEQEGIGVLLHHILHGLSWNAFIAFAYTLKSLRLLTAISHSLGRAGDLNTSHFSDEFSRPA